MGIQAQRLFEKHKINIEALMYITRAGRKSVLHLEDGKQINTFLPIKELQEELPQEAFTCINKGIVVAITRIKNYSNNVYTMTDGAQFKGRLLVSASLENTIVAPFVAKETDAWKGFSILEDMPVAFCIIEIVFDKNGRGVDFIFRYCNTEMEKLEGKRLDEMQDRSFYEVFENGDKKWLVTYADVALNGTKRVIESFSPEINANLRIYCYRPKPNFCACLLVKL